MLKYLQSQAISRFSTPAFRSPAARLGRSTPRKGITMIATFILAHLFLAYTDEIVPEALTRPLTVSLWVAWGGVVATAVDTRVGGSGIGADGIGDERVIAQTCFLCR